MEDITKISKEILQEEIPFAEMKYCEICHRISQERSRQALTRQKLATMVNVDLKTIVKAETMAWKEPPLLPILKICHALGIKITVD